MEEPRWKKEKEKAGKTVRFRVAAANSGRVLAEVFKDEAACCASLSDSAASEQGSSAGTEPESPRPPEANSHLSGLRGGQDESGCEADDLLLYASAKRDKLFSRQRIDICSQNGTIRGVRNKVSAGQVLFNSLCSHPVSRPAELGSCSPAAWSLSGIFLSLSPPSRRGGLGRSSERMEEGAAPPPAPRLLPSSTSTSLCDEGWRHRGSSALLHQLQLLFLQIFNVFL